MTQKCNIILIDEPRKEWKWHSHMVCANIQFLHEFAESIGLGRHMYSNKRGKNRPHYDVPRRLFAMALEKGAVQVPSEEIVNFLKEHFE